MTAVKTDPMNEPSETSSSELEVSQLESLIREHFGNHRLSINLMPDTKQLNRFFSALDCVGDAECGLTAYLEMSEPDNVYECYPLIYGALQMLYVEQDAVKAISEITGLDYDHKKQVKEIREIRNASIGHPTQTLDGQSHYIARASMTTTSFDLLSVSNDERPFNMRRVNMVDLIEKQRDALRKVLSLVYQKIRRDAMDHKKHFVGEKLADCFPPSTDYLIRKLYEASCDDCTRLVGKPHIKMLTSFLDEFEKALSARGLEVITSDEVSEIRYALEELKKYFSDESESKLNSQDAYIFISFVEQEFQHIRKHAEEIDENYNVP